MGLAAFGSLAAIRGLMPGVLGLAFGRRIFTLDLLALGPGRCSEFFDPKARVTPRPIIRRGKSGHHRAGCCASCKARAGAAFQSAVTDSVTENIPPGSTRRKVSSLRVRVKRWGKSPPRQRRRWRHEKPRLVQGKIGDWAARPIVAGMPHPPSLAQASFGGHGPSQDERERNNDRTLRKRGEQNPAYRPQS